MLATTAFLITGLTMSDATFTAWGWRIPFLVSVLLVAVGLWVRLGVTDTPVFKAAMEQAKTATEAKAPVVELFRNQAREVSWLPVRC